jgi:hypothetical protein
VALRKMKQGEGKGRKLNMDYCSKLVPSYRGPVAASSLYQLVRYEMNVNATMSQASSKQKKKREDKK